MKKVPYQLVIGENECANGSVTFRQYGKQAQETVSFDEFVSKIKDEVENKKRIGE